MPRPDEGMIHAWLDGELSAEEAERVAKLVAEDAEWGAAAAEARGLVAASSRIVSALDVVPSGVIPAGSRAAPAAKRRFTVKPWMRMAAGVVLVVGTATVVWTRTGNTPAPGEIAAKAAMADAAAPVIESRAANAPAAASPASAADRTLARRAEPERDSLAGARENVAVSATAGAGTGAVAAKTTTADEKLSDVAVTGGRLRQEIGKAANPESRVAPSDDRPSSTPASAPASARAPTPAPARAVSGDAGRVAAEQASGVRADLSESVPAVLPGCWRTQVVGRADTLLADPRVVRQTGDTLTLVIAADGRTAVVRRESEGVVRGETRFGAAVAVALIGIRVECPDAP